MNEVYVCYKCYGKFRKISKVPQMVFDNIYKKYDEELRARLREKRLSKIENILE